MAYKAIIFDFDGTIADTGRGVKNSIKYALSEHGIPVGDEKKLDYFIGPPLYEGFEHVYGLDREFASKLVDTYRVYYSKKGIYELDTYSGMRELLRDLKANGLILAVASSKPLHFLKTTVDTAKTTEFFDCIVGPELNNHNADKADLIREALSKIGITKEDYNKVIMVGDRFYDINGAKSVGIPSIGVTFGYGTKDELEEAGASFTAASVEELRQIVLS